MSTAPSSSQPPSSLESSPIWDLKNDFYTYRLIRSLQRNWTRERLVHRPFYRPFISLDTGVTSPPLLNSGDHYFAWLSEDHSEPLVIVWFCIHPGYSYPSPRVQIFHSLSNSCPSIVVQWWDFPTDPPFRALAYLYDFHHDLGGEDLSPFADKLSTFCIEYYRPVTPYQDYSQLRPTLPPVIPPYPAGLSTVPLETY